MADDKGNIGIQFTAPAVIGNVNQYQTGDDGAGRDYQHDNVTAKVTTGQKILVDGAARIEGLDTSPFIREALWLRIVYCRYSNRLLIHRAAVMEFLDGLDDFPASREMPRVSVTDAARMLSDYFG